MTNSFWNMLKLLSRDMKGKFKRSSMKAAMEERIDVFPMYCMSSRLFIVPTTLKTLVREEGEKREVARWVGRSVKINY